MFFLMYRNWEVGGKRNKKLRYSNNINENEMYIILLNLHELNRSIKPLREVRVGVAIRVGETPKLPCPLVF